MVLQQLKSNTFILALLMCAMLLMACDNNLVVPGGGETTNPNVSDPNNDVAVNVGPVQALVTQHVLDKANSIRGDIEDFITEEFGIDDDDGGFGLLIKFVDGGAENPVSSTIEFTESITCTSGGSRGIIGSATIILNEDGVSGTISGSFIIQYDSCKQAALLTTSDGFCSSTPTITGEVNSTISIDYTLSASDNEGEDTQDVTVVSTTNILGLDVTVDNSTSEQTYNFSYNLSTFSSDETVSGTVDYDAVLFDLNEVESFVAQSTSTVVCP